MATGTERCDASPCRQRTAISNSPFCFAGQRNISASFADPEKRCDFYRITAQAFQYAGPEAMPSI